MKRGVFFLSVQTKERKKKKGGKEEGNRHPKIICCPPRPFGGTAHLTSTHNCRGCGLDRKSIFYFIFCFRLSPPSIQTLPRCANIYVYCTITISPPPTSLRTNGRTNELPPLPLPIGQRVACKHQTLGRHGDVGTCISAVFRVHMPTYGRVGPWSGGRLGWALVVRTDQAFCAGSGPLVAVTVMENGCDIDSGERTGSPSPAPRGDAYTGCVQQLSAVPVAQLGRLPHWSACRLAKLMPAGSGGAGLYSTPDTLPARPIHRGPAATATLAATHSCKNSKILALAPVPSHVKRRPRQPALSHHPK